MTDVAGIAEAGKDRSVPAGNCVAQVILAVVALYAALGIAFAVAFVASGARRIDPAAAQGTRGFRALLLPGAALLWPALLRKWCAAARGRAR